MKTGEFLTRAANWYPNKVANIFEGKKFTYKQYNERVNSISNALREVGLNHQDRIGILSLNCHEYAEVAYASSKLGVICTTINWRMAVPEILSLIQDFKPKVIFVSKRFEAMLESLRKNNPDKIRFISMHGEIDGMMNYDKLLLEFSTSEPQSIGPIQDDDVVLQLYTSGTTGKQKGAMLTHKVLYNNTLNFTIDLPYTQDSNYLCLLPMFHVAIWPIWVAAYVGFTLTYIDAFDPGRCLALIDKEKVTDTGLTPTIIQMLMDHPDFEKTDHTAMKSIIYTGAPMPVELLKRSMKNFKCGFYGTYGMSEMAGGITFLRPDEHFLEGPEYLLKRLASVGRPCVNVNMKVLDDNGKECPVGVSGEICASAEHAMKGYFNMPNETAEALRDGWYHTGDVAYVDEGGYFYLVDRKVDMIISGGENIYPREIENVLLGMDGIADVAVIGVPDEKWGESVMALVVAKKGATVTESMVIDFCKERLASYKKPGTVDFMDILPRNPLGKIQKKELRAKYWKGKERKI